MESVSIFGGFLIHFADKKIIDLRLPSGTPGTEGAKALIAYCDRLPDDTLLLITAGKVASGAFKTRGWKHWKRKALLFRFGPWKGKI